VPRGPARDGSPVVFGSAEAGGAIELFANPTCLGPAAATGSSEQLAAGIPVPVPANATTVFSAIVIDVAGNVSACSGGSLGYTADTAPPETTITRGPAARTRDATPTFSAVSSEQGSRVKCLLDGKPSRRCGTFFSLRPLRVGRHTFSVVAIDRAGNADPTPAVRAFRVLRKKHRR
jgi:large repetitive protein